jgi:hypothetical protein
MQAQEQDLTNVVQSGAQPRVEESKNLAQQMRLATQLQRTQALAQQFKELQGFFSKITEEDAFQDKVAALAFHLGFKLPENLDANNAWKKELAARLMYTEARRVMFALNMSGLAFEQTEGMTVINKYESLSMVGDWPGGIGARMRSGASMAWELGRNQQNLARNGAQETMRQIRNSGQMDLGVQRVVEDYVVSSVLPTLKQETLGSILEVIKGTIAELNKDRAPDQQLVSHLTKDSLTKEFKDFDKDTKTFISNALFEVFGARPVVNNKVTTQSLNAFTNALRKHIDNGTVRVTAWVDEQNGISEERDVPRISSFMRQNAFASIFELAQNVGLNLAELNITRDQLPQNLASQIPGGQPANS